MMAATCPRRRGRSCRRSSRPRSTTSLCSRCARSTRSATRAPRSRAPTTRSSLPSCSRASSTRSCPTTGRPLRVRLSTTSRVLPASASPRSCSAGRPRRSQYRSRVDSAWARRSLWRRLRASRSRSRRRRHGRSCPTTGSPSLRRAGTCSRRSRWPRTGSWPRTWRQGSGTPPRRRSRPACIRTRSWPSRCSRGSARCTATRRRSLRSGACTRTLRSPSPRTRT
mmetsp:Transcript_9491/g.21776  ORF Transcript_9491/g.21776 Transcript_9491/m.21776 type:complete len:224 (+) Transcript_9491:544-1215(+)